MYDLITELGCGAGGISKEGNATAEGNVVGGCDQVYETLSPTISPRPTVSPRPSMSPSEVGQLSQLVLRGVNECTHASRFLSQSPTPAPTVSHAPSVSPSLSLEPTTSQPTGSPSISSVPSVQPSEGPTYSPTDIARVVATSPPTNSIQIQHGAMFDIKAKANITIYNLDISLYTQNPTDVTIFTMAGGFWRGRTYEALWTNIGTGEYRDKAF